MFSRTDKRRSLVKERECTRGRNERKKQAARCDTERDMRVVLGVRVEYAGGRVKGNTSVRVAGPRVAGGEEKHEKYLEQYSDIRNVRERCEQRMCERTHHMYSMSSCASRGDLFLRRTRDFRRTPTRRTSTRHGRTKRAKFEFKIKHFNTNGSRGDRTTISKPASVSARTRGVAFTRETTSASSRGR